MLFQDREEAGERLAEALRGLGLERPVVLGIPRGGVPVAARVARALGGDLGVIVARKLGAPWQPELAIGAVTADGAVYVNHEVASLAGADAGYIEAEVAKEVAEARRREEAFDHRRRPSLAGRAVIVIDDGVATGATAVAAVRSVRRAGAGRVVIAVPVGSPRTLRALRREADEVVCLDENPYLMGVGQAYVDFRQIGDGEVKAVLDAFARERAAREGEGAAPAA
jgi:predicted phosphoribosyltransferase